MALQLSSPFALSSYTKLLSNHRPNCSASSSSPFQPSQDRALSSWAQVYYYSRFRHSRLVYCENLSHRILWRPLEERVFGKLKEPLKWLAPTPIIGILVFLNFKQAEPVQLTILQRRMLQALHTCVCEEGTYDRMQCSSRKVRQKGIHVRHVQPYSSAGGSRSASP